MAVLLIGCIGHAFLVGSEITVRYKKFDCKQPSFAELRRSGSCRKPVKLYRAQSLSSQHDARCIMPRSVGTLAHEENVQRSPYEPPIWHDYLTYLRKHQVSHTQLFPIYERAVAALPGSYKLWHAYVKSFHDYAATHHPLHPSRQASLSVSRRATAALPRSPVVWTLHVAHLCQACQWTDARQAINNALRALPATQHDHIWNVVNIDFLSSSNAPSKTCVLLLRRFAKYTPGAGGESLFKYLCDAQMYREAVLHLAQALSDQDFRPSKTTRHQLWLKLAKTAAAHVDTIALDIPQLMRSAIVQEKDAVMVGELWVALSGYFTRKALFEYAIDVYEEALGSIEAVRDFALVFDAYAKFLEALVTAEMNDDIHEDLLELRMARLEHLTNRRPMLLSNVVLRQNPHNVHEWHKRARMFKSSNDPVSVVDTYTKALQIVDPWRATNGRPHTLWLAFARYYEDASDISSARRVLDKSVENPEIFRSAEDLAAVWCEYAEMELRCGSPTAARTVLLRAVTKPDKVRLEEVRKRRGRSMSNVAAVTKVGTGGQETMVTHQYDKSSPAWHAYKSKRIWHFLVDLTQSISSAADVVEIHERMLDLRIASPHTILSGATYLESQRLFEQAFRLYDKGASSISWPEALEVWVAYLTKFVKRFGSRKLERARNLFEEAIRAAPPSKKGGVVHPHPQLRILFMMYASMEEQHSLARHALKVFARAVKEVRDEDRPDLYRMYIMKLATMFGVTKTRPVYEEALSALLRPEDVLDFAVRYADMETRLGEIDRARGIFKQTSDIADPRRRGIFEIFWSGWNNFELTYGTEDTYRDMLREKRRVQLQHKEVFVDMDLIYDTEENGSILEPAKHEIQEGREEGSTENTGEALSSTTKQENLGSETEDVNTEEIAIELSDDDENHTYDASEPGTLGETGTNDAADTEKAKGTFEGTNGIDDTSSAKLKIVQRDLPSGVRNLLAAAHNADTRKRKRESEQDVTEATKEEDKPGAKEVI